MDRYAIGIDFGTLSGRALLVNVKTGEEFAPVVFHYPHAVMETALPSGKKLGVDWALQHPQDYLDVLYDTIPRLLRETGVPAEAVIGIGIDFTACTILPVKADGTPLCFLDAYRDEPHAYVKLWKHHAAQDKANRLNEVAAARGEAWLPLYGGKISSEWMFPKLWQVADEAPAIYEETDFFIEAADWIVWQLTGVQTRNSCTSGYKAMYNKRTGYPDKAFFAALSPALEHVVEEKLHCPISPLGQRAGGIGAHMAARTGLVPDTAVAVANVDAHVSVPAVKIDGPGTMLAIMGTSTCHMILSREEIAVPGMCGVVEDGILPGFFGYEAGQSCVGDHFSWFIDNCLPAGYHAEAEARGMNIHALLREKVAGQKPGQSGLVALDWFNGNRSVLVDADLTGVMVGLTLQTKPEEIYRALIEATAFGTRKIIETFEAHGVPVHAFYATGGIAQKDPMTMQIYADVINRPIRISGTGEGPALGSAIFGAVAAGSAAGGYDNVAAASAAMGKLQEGGYSPNAENSRLYDALYAEYNTLHHYFGEGPNDVMKRLKRLRRQAAQ